MATEEVVLTVSGDASGGVAALKQIGSALSGLWADMKKLGDASGVSGLSKTFSGLAGTVKSLGSTIGSALGGAGRLITATLLSPLTAVKGGLGAVGSAVGSLGGVFQTALGVVAGTAINTALSSLRQLAAEPVLVAARVGVLQKVLETVGSTAGYTKDQLYGYVDGLKETGISTREALNNVVKMIQANLDLSKAVDLAKVAQDAAVIAGENSSETFAGIMHGITSLSPIVLRHRGIVIDLQAEYKKWSQATGIAVADMTTMQKQQAALNAVLAAGQTISGAYTAAMTEAGKKAGSLKRYIEEAQLALGIGLKPVYTAVIDITANLLKSSEKLFTSIQPALTAFSTQVGAGLTALSEKGMAALSTLGSLISQVAPYLRELGDILGFYLPQVSSRLHLAWIALKNALSELASSVSAHLPSMQSLWTSFTDIVKGSLDGVLALLDGFRLALGGQGEQAAANFSNAIANGLAVLIIIWEDYISQALTWGYNLISTFAQGLIEGASAYIVPAITSIGNLIANFFAAFSPPKEGPLASILKWGRGLINTYFKGFQKADFGLLSQVAGHIKTALQSAVKLGDVGEGEMIPLFKQVREQAAAVIAIFRKTGEISEEALGQITATLGEGSQELVQLLRLQLEHQKALKEVAAIEEEIAAAEEKGWVPAELRKRLTAAQDSADAIAEEVSWQEEYLKAQQETVDLQAEQVSVMKQLTAAVSSLGESMGKIGKSLKTAEDPWGRFVSQYEEDMAVLEKKRALGLISEEEYLKGLESLQERYVEQAMRMGKPYEAQLAALLQTREKLKSLGAGVGGEDIAGAGKIALPGLDTERLKKDVDAGIKQAFEGVSSRFAEAKAKGRALMDNLSRGMQEGLAGIPGMIMGELGRALSNLRENVPFVDVVLTKLESLKAWWNGAWPGMLATFLTVWTVIRTAAGVVLDILTGLVFPQIKLAIDNLTQAMRTLGVDWSDVWRALGTAVGVVAAVIGAIILALIGTISGIAVAISSVAVHVTGVWADMAETFKRGTEAISRLVGGAMAIVKGIFSGDLALILEGWKAWKDGLLGLISAVGEGAINFFNLTFGTLIAAVRGFVEGFISYFIALYDRLVGGSIITDLAERFVALFQQMYDETIGKVEQFVQQFLDKLAQFRDQAAAIAEQARMWIVEKIQGIADSFTRIGSAVEGALSNLSQFLSTLAGAIIPDWLLPGSATPFETGILGIIGAIGQLSQAAQGLFIFAQMKADLSEITTVLIPLFTSTVLMQVMNLRTQLLAIETEFSASTMSKLNILASGVISLLLTFKTRSLAIVTSLTTMVTALFEKMRRDVVASTLSMVSEVLAALSSLLDEAGSILDDVKEVFEDMANKITEAIQKITGEIHRLNKELDGLIEKAKEAEGAMKDAGLMGDSPSRFELSLLAINDALRRVQQTMGGVAGGMGLMATPTPIVGGEKEVISILNQFFEGAFSGAFPGVRDSRDAERILAELNDMILRSSARASIPGGIT